MVADIVTAYQTRFQGKPLVVRAPGRINLIGEHTDYNLGWVMPASIDQALYFALGQDPSSTQVKIWSTHFEASLVLEAEKRNDIPDWGAYFQAMIDLLAAAGMPVQGVQCTFGGTIPLGAGLSSSAALCCGFIFGLSHLLGLKLSKKQIVLLAQQAEQRVGVNCGLMDQYAILFGRAGKVLQLDCQNLQFDYFPLALANYELVLIDTQIKHALAKDSAYNERRAACERVVAHFAERGQTNIRSLRDLSPHWLQSAQSDIDPLDFRRASYVLAENQRVQQMAVALQQQDWETCGQVLLAGHWGLSREYGVSLPAVDELVQLTMADPHFLGARMMGGGFGGCILSLVRRTHLTTHWEKLQAQYQAKTGLSLRYYPVKIADGIEKLPFA